MRNVAPIVSKPLPDVSARVGDYFEHVLPPDAFLDRQSDGRLTSDLLSFSLSYAETPDLAWLYFDAPQRRMHGVPTTPGTWAITAIATDPGFREGADPPLSTPDTFLLHVVGQPVVSEATIFAQ